ncbi:MAG: glutamate formimidoyltransferase [Vicinamibacterales bacterium]
METHTPMIESVPNVSEGHDTTVVSAIADAVRAVPAVLLLDHSSDPSHNRSVFTMAGAAAPLLDALLRLAEAAIARVDLRVHRGVHPRIGAVDVVPLIPLGGSTMAACVDLSHQLARALADRFGLPVYLYEHSASRPTRRRLEVIRRGHFEGLAEKMKRPEWAPDYGPAVPHPTAGATVVGARMPLIAYNVNLDSTDLEVARAVALAVRESSGGLPCVKALGLPLLHRGVAQVSMNLTDFTRTSVQEAFDAVVREAGARGVGVLESELIGLIPEAALVGTSAERLRLTGFTRAQILEERIAQRLAERPTRP